MSKEVYLKEVQTLAEDIYQRAKALPSLNVGQEIVNRIHSHPWLAEMDHILGIVLYGAATPNFDRMGREMFYKGVDMTLAEQAFRTMSEEVSEQIKSLYEKEFGTIEK